ncbi:MAG: DHH family phosphoesterase [Promethearchaeia archaeon]
MIILLTHEVDLDGLGSQAIIKRYLTNKEKTDPEKVKLRYAHYPSFLQKIREILNSEPLPERVYITDIGFNKQFADLFPDLKSHEEKGCQIFWFDHHVVDKKEKTELKDLISLYKNNTDLCTAEIVKDYFLPEDPIAEQVVKYARDMDFRIYKHPTAEKLQSVISYNRGKKNENKDKIVNHLMRGEFNDSWFDDQYESFNDEREEKKQFALQNAQFFNLQHFGEIVMSYAKEEGGTICKYLQKKYPDIGTYVGIDERYNEVIIYSNEVDCRKLAREFNGGGHKNRAGFKYLDILKANNTYDPSFTEKLFQFLLKYKLK